MQNDIEKVKVTDRYGLLLFWLPWVPSGLAGRRSAEVYVNFNTTRIKTKKFDGAVERVGYGTLAIVYGLALVFIYALIFKSQVPLNLVQICFFGLGSAVAALSLLKADGAVKWLYAAFGLAFVFAAASLTPHVNKWHIVAALGQFTNVIIIFGVLQELWFKQWQNRYVAQNIGVYFERKVPVFSNFKFTVMLVLTAVIYITITSLKNFN